MSDFSFRDDCQILIFLGSEKVNGATACPVMSNIKHSGLSV